MQAVGCFLILFIYFSNKKMYGQNNREAGFAKHFIVDALNCSEYDSGSEYTRVLNMLLVLKMLEFWTYFSWNIGKFRYARVLNTLLDQNTPVLLVYLFWNMRKFCYASGLVVIPFLKYKEFLYVRVPNIAFLEYKKSSVMLGVLSIPFLK